MDRPGGPNFAVGTDQSQIAHVIGHAHRHSVLELGLGVALPEIGRLEDVHVAV
jgi:hypothetical protein